MSAAPAAAIGVGRVAHATPDGYTVSIGHTQTHVFNASILKLDYDVVNDFAPISLIADTPIWIVDAKIAAGRRPQRLIAWLKAENGKATMGMVGVGSPTEFAAEIFAKATGTSFQFVPYRGGAPLLQDMLGDHIDFAFGQAAGYLTTCKAASSRLSPYCSPSAGGRRPTCRRSTSSASTTSTRVFGMASGRPRARRRTSIAKLNAAVRVALADPTMQERFKKVGQEIWPVEYQTPEALAAKQKAELAKWTPVILECGIKAE